MRDWPIVSGLFAVSLPPEYRHERLLSGVTTAYLQFAVQTVAG